MILFSLGTVILSIIRDPSDTVSLRSISAITSMFSAVIGLVLGYLVGRNGNGRRDGA